MVVPTFLKHILDGMILHALLIQILDGQILNIEFLFRKVLKY